MLLLITLMGVIGNWNVGITSNIVDSSVALTCATLVSYDTVVVIENGLFLGNFCNAIIKSVSSGAVSATFIYSSISLWLSLYGESPKCVLMLYVIVVDGNRVVVIGMDEQVICSIAIKGMKSNISIIYC